MTIPYPPPRLEEIMSPEPTSDKLGLSHEEWYKREDELQYLWMTSQDPLKPEGAIGYYQDKWIYPGDPAIADIQSSDWFPVSSPAPSPTTTAQEGAAKGITND